MRHTPEQEAVITFVSDDQGSAVVDAVAGSGKTATLVDSIKACSHMQGDFFEVLCLAFNKRIADELGARMPDFADCRTTHSVGMRAWGKMAKERLNVDNKKGWKIMDKLGVDHEQCPDLRQLVAHAKNAGIVPAGPGIPDAEEAMLDDTGNWQDLIDDHALDMGTILNPINTGRDFLSESIRMSIEGRIDFDDMLYMPTIFGGDFPRPDILMVDEAQDISFIQRKMFHRMTDARDGRLIAVGDRHQAIYGFRGADYGSLDRIHDGWGCRGLALTYSFRCPEAVVSEAQKYVPHIKSAPGAPAGKVDFWNGYSGSHFNRGDAIICRNNKPLISLCFQLLADGVAATVLGREIGQQLVGMIKKQKAIDLEELHQKLEEFWIKQVNYLHLKGKVSQADLLEDKLQAIDCIAERVSTVQELIQTIESMFSDKQGQVTLSTVHKAKGLEWNRVFFLDKYLIPSKFAKTDAQLQQERNLAYVAITRSKDQLYYINSEDYR